MSLIHTVDGVGVQAMADANQTPSSSVYCYSTIKCTGALTAARDLTLPTLTDAAGRVWTIDNSTTGGYDVVAKCAAGTTVSCPAGLTTVLVDSRGATKVSSSVGGAGSTPTGTGFRHVTSGSEDAAAAKVTLNDSADVDGIPGNATEVIVNSGGTALGAATGVKAGSGYISVATSPASTGVIRLGDSGDLSQIVWKDGGGTDRALVSTSTTGNGTTFGYTAGPTNLYGSTCTIYSASSSTFLYGAAVQQMSLDGTNINHLTPMAGSTTAGMRLTQNALAFAVATDYTLSGAEIAAPYQKYSDSGGGPGSGTKNIIGPTQTGAIYFVDNRMTATYVLFKTSGGTGPTIQVGYRAWVICDGTDYKLMAAATNA